MKKTLATLALAVFLLTLLGASVAMADLYTTRAYQYTDSISASLSVTGGTAYCSGSVDPTGTYSASVTLNLYRQNGSSWTYITSWSGSATGGAKASASGNIYVGSGTFKLVVKGNVGNGLEYPTITKTK
ncbi:MAG: hypothetical protein J6K72_04895 [Clostridia bacterium]|nr:hypothetical protein [Clostridia bacterium]